MIEASGMLRLGTRGSALALWQSHHVAALLQAAWPRLHIEFVVIYTQGDVALHAPLPQLGGKGLFTSELEAGLLAGSIDLAVHSLKDLPTRQPAGLVIGALPPRGDARDVLVSRSGCTLDDLSAGSVIGTSSLRRAAQLRRRFSHLRILDIRGNVDTRIGKALDPHGPYDGILLAQAGVERLGRSHVISQTLDFDLMLPAPGQAALAVQCRATEPLLALLAAIDDPATRTATTCERAFLAALGGGCSAPVAAFAQVFGRRLFVRGRVVSVDGAAEIDVALEGAPADAEVLGVELAQLALSQGAALLLERKG